MGRIFPFSIMLIVVLLLAAPVQARQKRSSKLKLATLAPQGTSYHKALMRMRDAWRKCESGGVQLLIYPDGQMGGESDMVRRMRAGTLHLALMTASGLAEIDESITALQNMPMMFNTFEEVEHVRGKLLSMIEQKFLDKGFVILSLEDTGWVKFFTKVRAATPDEFSSLKLFALSSDTKAVQLWKSAGFNPVPLDTTAMLTGLKTGMIDAIPSPPYYALATQSYTSAPFMLDLKWAPLVGGIVIRKDAWNKLPNSAHEYLRKAAEEAGREVRTAGRAKNTEAIAEMKGRGLTIVTPTAEELEKWRTTVEKAYPMIRGKLVPADLFDQVQGMIKEYRKTAK